jgi:hypothetical protein
VPLFDGSVLVVFQNGVDHPSHWRVVSFSTADLIVQPTLRYFI